MRMWEIRENDESRYGHRFGTRNRNASEIDEAYECGYEEGYRKAMKEAESYYGQQYNERRPYRR